jgi:transcriptional regulator with XRE-family HTH domain
MKSAVSEREVQIGRRLRMFRESKMIPRTAFALSIGVGAERLASYEAGRVPLRFGVFLAIHQRHLIDPAWLATGQGNPVRSAAFSLALQSSFPPRALFSDIYAKYLANISSDRAVILHEGIDQLNRMLEDTIQDFRAALPELGSSIAGIETRLRAAQQSIADARKHASSLPLSNKRVAQFLAYLNTKYWKKEKGALTGASLKSRTPGMKIRTLDELRAVLRAKTSRPGDMARLAKALGLRQARVSEWLSGKKEPGGKTTFRLLQWVEQQERQQKSPGGVEAPPERKTQVSKTGYEKQTQVPKKG